MKNLFRYLTLRKRIKIYIIKAEKEILRLEVAKNKGHFKEGSKLLIEQNNQIKNLQQMSSFLQKLL